MATKEAAVGGAVLAGGGAGGGYAAYRYLGGSSEEENENNPGSEESDSSPTTTIKQKLEAISSSTETGKPISTENNSEQWKKSHHRYFLEIKESDGDKMDELGGENIREKQYEDKSETLKAECKKLFDKLYKSDADTDYKKAKKWCTTYKTVRDTLEEGRKNKDLKEDSESNWSTNYDTAVTDTNLKTVLEGLKKEFSSETDDNQKKKTLHKWCTMALNASESYQFKDKVNSSCIFKD